LKVAWANPLGAGSIIRLAAWGGEDMRLELAGPWSRGPVRETAMTERRFRRNFESLASIVAFVNEFFAAHGIRAEQANDVNLIIEELFTNMVKYSRESREDVAVGLEWNAPVITLKLEDFGVEPFDVTQPPPIDAAAKPGGLGLQLVQRMAESLDYRWANRVSTITATKRLDV
jgi:anti-sigma regulatory factor (Ser/Thr protein kinase)